MIIFVRIQIEDYKFDLEEVELRYANWSAEEILKGIFPHNVTPVTGFSVVGHMAHLNLRDEHSPYKKLIGERHVIPSWRILERLSHGRGKMRFRSGVLHS